MEAATAPVIAPIYNLIGSLGSAAAAVAVVYMFMGYIRESAKRQEDMFERLTMEFARVGKEKSDVIHQVALSLDNNTKALERFDATVKIISERLIDKGSR